MKPNQVGSKLSHFFPYSEGKVNYLTNCSDQHKFVYVETPKVACSTIKKVLQLIELEGDEASLPAQVHNRKESPLLAPRDFSIDYNRLFHGNDFFRFCFVRNPFSRILSAYLDKIVTNQWERDRRLPAMGFEPDEDVSFINFLKVIRAQPDAQKDIHWMPQAYILQLDKVEYSYIGRFENFRNDFHKVIHRIEPDRAERFVSLKVDFHKTEASKKIRQYIGRQERDIIIEIFANDFETFGYSYDLFF